MTALEYAERGMRRIEKNEELDMTIDDCTRIKQIFKYDSNSLLDVIMTAYATGVEKGATLGKG